MLYDSFISFSFHPSISDKKQEMRSCNSPLNYISCGFHKFIVSPYQEVILFHSTTSPCSIVYFGFYYFQLSQSPTRKICPCLPLPGNTWVCFPPGNIFCWMPHMFPPAQQKRIDSRLQKCKEVAKLHLHFLRQKEWRTRQRSQQPTLRPFCVSSSTTCKISMLTERKPAVSVPSSLSPSMVKKRCTHLI